MTSRIVSCGGSEDNISPVIPSAGIAPVGSSETAAGSLQSDASFSRHGKYYFEDGNITFLVNDVLYRVHRYLFSCDSEYFSTRFARLEVCDHEALSTIISLRDVECEDFEAFLSVLYPDLEEHQFSYDQWRSILHLSTRWGFTPLRELALRSIRPPTPCDQLLLARIYAVDHWIVPALTALCQRTAPLNLDEVRRLNDEDVVLIVTVREDIRTPIGVSAAEISRRVEAMQDSALARAVGDDGSLASSTSGAPYPDGLSVAGAGPTRAQPKASDLSHYGNIDKATPKSFTSTSGCTKGDSDPKSHDSPTPWTSSNPSMSSILPITGTDNTPRALPSALATARHIEDINCITYPEGIQSPKAELNVNTQSGKFLYDRDFLLQFINICKERPENLPPLDVIGIEPRDPSLSKWKGGSGRSRTSNDMSMPGNSRSATIDLGIASGLDKSTDIGFQMGQFSTSAGKMSSDERSLVTSADHSTPDSWRPLGGNLLATVRTIGQDGTNRRNRIRTKRGANDSNRASLVSDPGISSSISNVDPPMEPVVHLEVSTNRWVATSAHGNGSGLDSESPEAIGRKVKALLNKLTMERFDSISDQIIAWENKSEKEKDGRTVIQVIKLVFEKAVVEARYSEMYARLCRKMIEQISPKVQNDEIKNSEGKPLAGGELFSRYFLGRCQEDFECVWVAKDATTTTATKETAEKAVKEANEKTKGGEKSELYSDEYHAAAKAKHRRLGLIRFIGELFKLQMLTERIVHKCIKKLLGNVEHPEEEKIESLCKLLITVGGLLDTPKARVHLDVYFACLRELAKNKNVNARLVFMLQDVIELRERKWIPRNAVAAPARNVQGFPFSFERPPSSFRSF